MNFGCQADVFQLPHHRQYLFVEFNFIELPKLNKAMGQLETSVEQWAYFIKNAESLTVIPENVRGEGLRGAYTGADRQHWAKGEPEGYERPIKERDEIGRIGLAEKKGGLERNLEVANHRERRVQQLTSFQNQPGCR